jgi:YVTN family beta-propeller protein
LRHIFVACLACFWCCAAPAAPYAYVPYPNGVAVFDVASNERIWDIPMPGAAPAGVAIAPVGGRAYFGDVLTDQVYVVETAGQSIVTRIKVASGPAALAVNPSGTRLVVGSAGTLLVAGSTLSLIDTAANTVVATAESGLRPAAAVFSADGNRIYVANGESHTITVHDAQTLETLAEIPVPLGPVSLALHPSGNRLYVGHIGTLLQSVSVVSVVDLDANAVTATITLGTRPALVRLNSAGTRLYVGNVEDDSINVVDTATNAVLSTIGIRQSPTGMDLTPEEDRLYVPTHGGGMAVIDIASRKVTELGYPKTIVLGRFIAPRSTAPAQADTPLWLSGLWWSPQEPGWGLSITQRRDVVFAVWFTYDQNGAPKWYVVSQCRTYGFTGCAGELDAVSGPRFFGATFNPSAVTSSWAGWLYLTFTGPDNANLEFQSAYGDWPTRSLSITRQSFSAGNMPGVNYTDLWWNPSESGWGLSVTQQGRVMFLAWFVYDGAGKPVWYVASDCTVNAAGNGCSGTLYRTTGPALAATFDPSQVHLSDAGTVNLSFTDGNNGVLGYNLGGQSGTKAITRQRF